MVMSRSRLPVAFLHEISAEEYFYEANHLEARVINVDFSIVISISLNRSAYKICRTSRVP